MRVSMTGGGCERSFDERSCWLALDPHPDGTSSWEIDMANRMANTFNFPSLSLLLKKQTDDRLAPIFGCQPMEAFNLAHLLYL